LPPALATGPDDKPTIISIAILACVLQDILHEGLGHGVTAWLSGSHKITMSTIALQSDIDTPWISANGTLVNLAAAAVLWLILKTLRRTSPSTRYFLVLAMAGNLFTGTGSFLFSGVADLGDWAAVIRGLEPQWLWRIGLIVLGAASYYLSMLMVAAALRPFRTSDRARLRGLCWTPYFTDAVLAGIAGLLNPAGLFYVIASALPSTLGANAGLWSLPFMVHGVSGAPEPAGPSTRRPAWIAAGAIAAVLFIVILGGGITWRR
jgi:hypothetical protein